MGRRPSGALSLPAHTHPVLISSRRTVRPALCPSLRPRTSFYPSRSLHKPSIRRPSLPHYDNPKCAVFLNVAQNSTMFERRPSNPPTRRPPGSMSLRPHTSFYPPRRLCTRFIRRPSLPHYDGSKRAVFSNVVRKKYVADRQSLKRIFSARP